MTTTPTPAPATTSNIWYTDRTRFKAGISRCPRQRYLSSSFGGTGYGIVRRADSLPLVTGIFVHQGLQLLVEVLKREGRLPRREEVREFIATLAGGYLRRVEARGYRGILGGEETEEVIREQVALISGLVWVLYKQFLPWFHDSYEVMAVEQERVHFLECVCGAPPLDHDEHIRRGCTGKALMIRTDLLGRHRQGRNLAYFEAKTTGWESSAWAEQWETDIQLALGTLGAEQLWGAEVTELYVVGLNKGRRAKDRYEDDPKKRQQSPLCYGYLRPGDPPLSSDDWLPSYEFVDNLGVTRRKSKAHRRRGIWLLEESDWPVWLAYKQNQPELTPEEFWTAFLPESILSKTCFVLGPMNRQDEQLRTLVRGMRGEEDRWQWALWALYELQSTGHGWASEEFQERLDELVPCSWACRPFGKEHQCEFVPVCHRHTGWDDPMATGLYQPRLPHHEPELRQAVARGLLVAEAEEATDEEDR